MGQATRITKLAFNFGRRTHGGVNTTKRAYLDTTVAILNQARAFYVDFFLAHAAKFAERVTYFSEKHQDYRERSISADELLTWAEACTISTKDHSHPFEGWNFSTSFPGFPAIYRRSVIKDAIGKVRSYLSSRKNWEAGCPKKGKPGLPQGKNHPTLYKGTFRLELDELNHRDAFVQIKIYTGKGWEAVNFPVKANRWCTTRLQEKGWETQSPMLVVRPKQVALHISQVKEIKAKKVKEQKLDPDLVTIGIDLNVKNLAVITVRQRGAILKTVFCKDHGLDQHRYHHLKRISKRQWQSGKPVKGERSCRHLWDHVKRTNQNFAHCVSRTIAEICAQYSGSILLFERLRSIKSRGENKTRRLNRKLSNQIRGQIRDKAKEKAFTYGTVTVEVNPHGTSQYCSRCGAKGERFSYRGGQRVKQKNGKLFSCPVCHYEANADFNASANTHHSFYREFHWQPQTKPSSSQKKEGKSRSVRLEAGRKKHARGTPR
jgi:IS605 OrfB family transposase